MIKNISFYTLLVLFVPIVAWITGWKWAGDDSLLYILDYPLYWLTETGSVPYALITCILLMFWAMYLVRSRYTWLLVGIICAGSVIGTQVIKTGAKYSFAEPRPYVVEIMGERSEQFYELNRDERAVLVAKHYQNSAYPLIAEHRANETGYSFPSGHTIFAVSWLLVFVGLLSGIQARAVTLAKAIMLLWTILMLISRLRLGMHYPIDLFVSTLVAWLFHLVLFIWVVPYLKTWTLFKKRG